MFNSLGSSPSYRVTTRQPPHHSHRCPLSQVQRKHRLHQNPRRRPTTLNPKAPTSPTPIYAPLCAHQFAKIQHKLNLNCPPNSTHADPNRPHQNQKNITVLNLTPPSKCVAVLSLAQDPRPKPPAQPVPTFSRLPQVLEPDYPTKCVAVLSKIASRQTTNDKRSNSKTTEAPNVNVQSPDQEVQGAHDGVPNCEPGDDCLRSTSLVRLRG